MAVRVDREGLIVVAMENYHLLVGRGLVSRVEFPLAALGGRAFDEGGNLDVGAASQDELARIGIEFIDEPAVVFLSCRHSRQKRRTWIILRSHEGEAIIHRQGGIAPHNRAEVFRAGDNGKDRLGS